MPDLFSQPAPSVDVKIEPSWKSVMNAEFSKEYFFKIKDFLLEEKKKNHVVYPPGNLIFSAFNLTPFDKVKVVILGQDPYHGRGQAHGLCFSVPYGITPPPSLVNIFKELNSDLGIALPNNGNLENWARQGVLLLNALLTVRANEPASHRGIGWENFTDAVIRKISEKKSGIVFLLWGKFAQEKEVLIVRSKHFILKAAHPSPYSASAGFFGCRHFSKTNDILISQNKSPVNWQLKNI
jgi:uracil-DNA glycosylase